LKDLDVAILLDGDNLGGVADGAFWQLLLQGLQQQVAPDATDFQGPSASGRNIHVSI
jgi:hypothetical protein